MNISILVVTHKKYDMPNDHIYIPIQSGSALNHDLGYQRDDEGDNISDKNVAYNILCAKYWGWRNLHSDVVGIVHYRRHLSIKKNHNHSLNDVIRKDEIIDIMSKNDVIVSEKRYYPLSKKNHYIYTKGGYIEIHKKDYFVLRKILRNYDIKLLTIFDKHMKRFSYHSGSIFIMRKNVYNQYCKFLFYICPEIERLLSTRCDKKRYIASLTELLLDSWIEYKDLRYKELPLIELEKKSFLVKSYYVMLRIFTGFYNGIN